MNNEIENAQYPGQGGMGEAYSTLQKQNRENQPPKSKETLRAEWDLFPRLEDTLNHKLVDEISPEVLINAGISLEAAERLGAALIEICKANFLAQTIQLLELLKSEHVSPIVPKATAGGINLAGVAIADLFKPEVPTNGIKD